MDKKQGIEQITKVLDVIIEGGNVAEKVAAATSVMGKVMSIVPMADELLRLMSLSPVVLKSEYADLDEAEKQQLRDHINNKFDLSNDDLEARLELGLILVGEAVDLVNKAVAYAKSFKKEG